MLSLRSLLLTALAVSAGVANAAECDEDFTIESDGDAAELASCSKFEGTLTIGEKVASVNLDGVERITGDLIVEGARALTNLAASRLTTIDGKFELRDLTVLGTLSFPELLKVGELDFQTLPALKQLGFAKGISEAGSVRISDTMLTSLDGLKLSDVKSFNINNNKFLKSVDVELTSVSEALLINFNGKGVQAAFPELKWARNVTIQDAANISFPKLEKVNNSLSFTNNTFEEAHFPKLKTAGDFSMVSCIKLTNVSANALESVDGTFLLANNTKLEEVNQFKELAEVAGSVDISGALTKVELPSLDDVRGGLNVQSTEELDCDALDELKGGAVKGKYECKGKLEVAESTSENGASTQGDGSSSGSDDEEDDSNAAGSVAVNFGLAAALGALTIFML
jgi:hypothetical protein